MQGVLQNDAVNRAKKQTDFISFRFSFCLVIRNIDLRRCEVSIWPN